MGVIHNRGMIVNDFDSIISKLEGGEAVSREEIAVLLDEKEEARLNALFDLADRVRKENVGDEIHVRALIEISNNCRRGCLYCGLRGANAKLARYRMPMDEILQVAREAADRGRKTLVLQSGEDAGMSADWVAELVRKIKSKMDVAITLSLGEYSRADYAKMKEAGADRYLIKHEIINPELYARLNPDMSFENRIRCLRTLRELGFQVGGGFMVGLPGQTALDLADDVLFLKEFDIDMAGIGPFIPHPNTPLARSAGGTFEMTMKTVAVTRILIPRLLMPATTAAGSIQPGAREKLFRCGANVVMPNATPLKYRELYEIYPGRVCLNDSNEDTDVDVEKMIIAAGRKVGGGYGHSYRRN